MSIRPRWIFAAACVMHAVATLPAGAQTPPGADELARYTGLHAAAAKGDAPAIEKLIADGAKVDARDAHGRTPLHVAVHLSRDGAARALVKGGADPRALDSQRYD